MGKPTAAAAPTVVAIPDEANVNRDESMAHIRMPGHSNSTNNNNNEPNSLRNSEY